MFCYSNNGFSMKAVENNYVAQAGEVLFSDYATIDQLTSAFSGYVATKQQQSLDALDAEYDPQFDALTLAWATASMAGDTATAAARLTDKTALRAEYQTKREAITNG